MTLHWTNLNFHHPRMFRVKQGWNWPCGSGEVDLYISLMYFYNFVFIPLGKGSVHSFVQTWIHTTQGCFELYFVEIGPVEHGYSFEQTWISATQGCFVPGLIEMGSMVLENTLIYRQWFFPVKRRGLSFAKFWSPNHPRMLCAKFGWNPPCGSGEQSLWISSVHFRYFIMISPWERA